MKKENLPVVKYAIMDGDEMFTKQWAIGPGEEEFLLHDFICYIRDNNLMDEAPKHCPYTIQFVMMVGDQLWMTTTFKNYKEFLVEAFNAEKKNCERRDFIRMLFGELEHKISREFDGTVYKKPFSDLYGQRFYKGMTYEEWKKNPKIQGDYYRPEITGEYKHFYKAA